VIPLQSKVKKKFSTASNKTIYKMETFTHVKLQPMMKTVVSLYAGLHDTPDDNGNHAVWQPIPNITSEYLVSGEALYVDDIPSMTSE
jgi:hypothetical protein